MKKTTFILVLIIVIASFLRLWKIDSVPVGLFGDEADVGYHAYSILKTGKDSTGNFAFLYVTSIADKKAPLYSYLAVPSVGIFGVSPLGVRLPAVFFGILGVLFIYLLVELLINRYVALLSAFLLAISPWHIQLSRWGLEHTLMLSLFLVGVYLFLKSFSKNKWLIASSICLALTPYAYHAAKIFLPLILICMVLLWWKEIKKIANTYLLISGVILLVIGGLIIGSSIFGSSAERFNSLSIFNDPKNEGEIGLDRVRDNNMNSLFSNLFHNKYTLIFNKIENNYLTAFSTDFLFIRGDINIRHSILQNGEFYKYQLPFLILGLIFLATRVSNVRYKIFIILWLLLAPLPSVITSGGGAHAARLFFMLPPMIILIAAGIYQGFLLLNKKNQKVYITGLSILIISSLIFYLHNYFVHYPWDSQKWWNGGYDEAIKSAVFEGKNYDKVFISSADEPSLLFFLAFSAYPPQDFQMNYPLKDQKMENIGDVQILGKYHFTPVGSGINLYELGSRLPDNSLYLATAKEINLDLIKEPDRVPSNLRLIKSIALPSQDPAFYLFTKK